MARRGIHDDPEFQEIRKMFVLEARSSVKELRGILEAAGEALPEGGRGVRFRKIAHDLRGAGGSYGFPIVSLNAGEAEEMYVERAPALALRTVVEMLGQSLRQAGELVDLPPEP
jgi:hypothetical protein